MEICTILTMGLRLYTVKKVSRGTIKMIHLIYITKNIEPSGIYKER